MKRQLQKAFKGLVIAQKEKINALYKGKDVVSQVLDGDILLLPSNLYIWATMNTSDQSLFPIDSAFKRRWDWIYIPISNAEKRWTIEVGGNSYDWWQFLEKINEKIGSTTNSEDKKLGYFFCKAQKGVISAKTFVGKVIFYLWNDVFKDYEFGDAIFNDEDGSKLSFDKFYTSEGTKYEIVEEKVAIFLKNLGIEPGLTSISLIDENEEDIETDENDEEDEDSNAQSSTNRDRYSVNGEGSYGKCRAPFEAVRIYVSQNPQMTASEIAQKWTSLNVTHLPYLVETEQEFEQRATETKDAKFRTKAKRLDLSNGETIYVSNQFNPTRINELISKLENINWGVHIALINN